MANGHLITGEKKAGKTTAVKKIVSGPLLPFCRGFYTEEMRKDGRRIGFRLTTLDGSSATIAERDQDRNIQTEFRAGNYIVDIEAFEAVALPALKLQSAGKGIIVIDEIGPMQILSQRFKDAVDEALEGPGVLLGTVVLRQFPWADEIKVRPGIELHLLTPENRDAVAQCLECQLCAEMGL